MLRAVLAIAIAIAALPLAAAAQSYRCVGKDGKKYYGQAMPPQCLGQPVEQLNAQGLVVKRLDAAATADERAKKDAEDADRLAALKKRRGAPGEDAKGIDDDKNRYIEITKRGK